MAFSHQMSLAGLAPMYAGRSGGWCLARALYGRVVYDSIACVRMSAPADRDEPVELALTRVLGGLLHRPVGGLDLDAVVDIRLDPFLFEKHPDAVGQPELADAPVGHDQYALEPKPSRVVRDLVGRSE